MKLIDYGAWYKYYFFTKAGPDYASAICFTKNPYDKSLITAKKNLGFIGFYIDVMINGIINTSKYPYEIN